MSSVSSMLGANGAGHSLSFNGKTYVASRITQRIKSDFESIIADRARATTLSLLGLLPEKEFSDRVSSLVQATACGKYSWGGDACREFLQTEQGILSFISLIFGIQADEATELVIGKQEEVAVVIRTVLLESIPKADAARLISELGAKSSVVNKDAGGLLATEGVDGNSPSSSQGSVIGQTLPN